MAGVVVQIVDFTYLTYLVAVDCHGGRYCQTCHIVVCGIVIVGGLEHVHAFEKVDSDKQQCHGYKHQHADYYFFSKYLFHIYRIFYLRFDDLRLPDRFLGVLLFFDVPALGAADTPFLSACSST